MEFESVKIVSGGQTGADRAALDWAVEHGVPHGGWCPKGRMAEDGPIAPRYLLKETPSSDYVQRTEWNARDSDGTVIFSIADDLSGGSNLTAEFAQQHKKPLLHLSAAGQSDAALRLQEFLQKHQVRVLNVAGPRASEEPAVGDFATAVLDQALRPRSIYVVDHAEVLASYELAFKVCDHRLPKIRFLTFTDPQAALQSFASAKPRPDLLITSYLLHSADGVSMNGLQLLEKCRAVQPGLKVLLTSSIPWQEVHGGLEKAPVRPDAFIRKPFDLTQLVNAVRDLLGLYTEIRESKHSAQGPAKGLDRPDMFHLVAAQGWLELGNHIEANEELQEITPELWAHPHVLEVRWQSHAAAKKWDVALDIASALIHLVPEQPSGWLHRSFSLHELRRTQEARDNLLSVVEKFPNDAIMRYNLACYECQLGRMKEAKDWLRQAFEIGELQKLKLMALEDRDLEPLWKDIAHT